VNFFSSVFEFYHYNFMLWLCCLLSLQCYLNKFFKGQLSHHHVLRIIRIERQHRRDCGFVSSLWSILVVMYFFFSPLVSGTLDCLTRFGGQFWQQWFPSFRSQLWGIKLWSFLLSLSSITTGPTNDWLVVVRCILFFSSNLWESSMLSIL
jgi:hypothetical protein